jgi:hypothetical protein
VLKVWANLRQQVASPDAWWRDDKAPEDRPRTPQDRKAIIAWWEQQVGVFIINEQHKVSRVAMPAEGKRQARIAPHAD